MEKGKYVSRSAYQKLAEENKKLMADIKILSGPYTGEKLLVMTKWRTKFEKDKMFCDLIKSMVKQNGEGR